MSDSAPTNGSDPLDFALLGPLAAVRDGHPLDLGGSRQRAILALLLLQPNRVVSLAQVIRGVWGEKAPPAAVRTAQTYVFHLRQQLEPDRPSRTPARVLTTTGAGYAVSVDPQSIDVGRFEAALEAARLARQVGDADRASDLLGSALALWRGPVLDDLAAYPFVRPEAARLEDLRLAAVEAKLDADLTRGMHDSVAAECERWIAREPLRERLREISMLALYRSGRQAEALSAYQRARAVLGSELGVEPGPGLQRIHQAVLEQSPSLELTPDAPYDRRATGPQRPAAAPERPGDVMSSPAGDLPRGWRPRRLSTRRRLATVAVVALSLATAGAGAIALDDTPDVASPQAASAQVASASVAVIDPGTGRVERVVPVGADPTQVAAGAGAVWVTNRQDSTVSRIDPRTRAVTQTIDVGPSPEAVAVGAGYVWVTNSGAGTVSQIDPATDDVVRTIPVGNGPASVVLAARSVWVANRHDDTVWRLDPRSGRVVDRIAVGDAPADLAVVGRGLLVANSGDATLSMIDTRTGEVTGTVGVGNGPVALGSARSAVWVANSLDGTVTRLDTSTSAQRSLEETGDGPADVAATTHGVWVTNQFSGTLTRLDAGTGDVVQRIGVAASPRGVAMVSGRLWVALGAGPDKAHRGGTLRVVEDVVASGIDPARHYGSAMFLAYDGLVALRRVGGSGGLTLVPDLATSVPRPTDRGRTYRFTLRRGVRYSDGRTVRPSDIRRGLERSVRGNPGTYFGAIRGADRCAVRPAPDTCDLSAGVVADDTRNELTIRLTEPDPELTAKLSTSFAAATAPGAPWTSTGRVPLPGTGPYRIESYTGKRGTVTLSRNPYFEQWSWAARPDGFADRIVFDTMRAEEAVRAVASGRADATTIVDGDVLVRHRPQVHVSPGSISFFMFLNTATPPFDDIRVRRALNLAVDRRAVLARYGGEVAGQVSCQVLLPSFPGYRQQCRYTEAPGSVWTAPDLDRARALIRASGPRRPAVEVVTAKSLRALAAYFPPLLRELGFDAHLKVLGNDEYFQTVSGPESRAQIGIYGWGADYPGASAFLTALFTCRGGVNSARFCDRDVDAGARRASALAARPAEANAAWAEVERAIMAAAPAVPLLAERRATFVSTRLGNYLDNPIQGPLYDQMWVR